VEKMGSREKKSEKQKIVIDMNMSPSVKKLK